MKNNILGKNIKQLRIERGISQRKLGEYLGVVNQAVSFWESGAREPDVDMLVNIANFFSVSLDYLVGREV